MALPNNDNIGEETREVLAAQAHIWNHTLSFINSMSLKCAIQLGFFIQEEEGYLLTPNSRLLLKDEPLSLVPLVHFGLDPNLIDPWHSLSKWLKDDDDSSAPFGTAHGKPLFEYTEKEPRLDHLFNEAMASDARLVMNVLIQNGKGIFEGLKSLVDVGGGTGTVAKAIADAFPEINCIVLDLPHVIEGLQGSKNLSFVGGDMFDSIPSAHAILLKWLLHDWGDKDCIEILKKCKEAIPSKENGGKLIIIDIVQMDRQKGEDNKSYETQFFFDMLMMVPVFGKQRSEQDWGKLFSAAGFSDYNIIPILGLRSIIEVYP